MSNEDVHDLISISIEVFCLASSANSRESGHIENEIGVMRNNSVK